MANWQIGLLCISFIIVGIIIGYIISYIRNNSKQHNREVDHILEAIERIDSNIVKTNNNSKKSAQHVKDYLEEFENHISSLDIKMKSVLNECSKPIEINLPDIKNIEDELKEIKIKLETISQRLKNSI